jgi:hypothetical protein
MNSARFEHSAGPLARGKVDAAVAPLPGSCANLDHHGRGRTAGWFDFSA